ALSIERRRVLHPPDRIAGEAGSLERQEDGARRLGAAHTARRRVQRAPPPAGDLAEHARAALSRLFERLEHEKRRALSAGLAAGRELRDRLDLIDASGERQLEAAGGDAGGGARDGQLTGDDR